MVVRHEMHAMNAPRHKTGSIRAIVAAAVLLAFAAGAAAQQRGGKDATRKLYCWNENGVRICGDALPPGATDLARTEIDARSGSSREVGRALTDAERAAAAEAERQAAAEAAAAADSKRHDLAMVESYATEADLQKAYDERISLLDDALKGSSMAEANLRRALVSLLDQANGLELARRPIPRPLLDNLRGRHADLVKQRQVAAAQRAERAALDGELADAIARYRAMKGEPAKPAVPATP